MKINNKKWKLRKTTAIVSVSRLVHVREKDCETECQTLRDNAIKGPAEWDGGQRSTLA